MDLSEVSALIDELATVLAKKITQEVSRELGLPSTDLTPIQKGKSLPKRDLDAKNQRILALCGTPQATEVIAKVMGLSISAVQRRVAKLKSANHLKQVQLKGRHLYLRK